MYICIEGNIGVGKTTLASALAKELKASFLAERFEENTLLPLFYHKPKTFAFPTEYSFLIDRQKQLVSYFKEIPEQTSTVSDFHFDKCICFAKANLSDVDFLFYKKHFKAIQKTVPVPDMVVYLTAPPGLLMKNIQKRGRALEKDMKQVYLEGLKKSLDAYYLKGKKTGTFVLVLTVNEYTDATISDCIVRIKKAMLTLKK